MSKKIVNLEDAEARWRQNITLFRLRTVLMRLQNEIWMVTWQRRMKRSTERQERQNKELIEYCKKHNLPINVFQESATEVLLTRRPGGGKIDLSPPLN